MVEIFAVVIVDDGAECTGPDERVQNLVVEEHVHAWRDLVAVILSERA
jgi:hypothetical protein